MTTPHPNNLNPDAKERSTGRLWLNCVLFGIAYFALAKASVLLSAKDRPDLCFWLPVGLFLSVLLLHESKSWPWLILAGAVANILFDVLYGSPLAALPVFILSNTVCAVAGALLVRKYVGPCPSIANMREFAGVLVFGGIVATGLGAFICAAGEVVLGMSHDLVRSFLVLWGSDSMATLIVSPFVLSCFANPSVRRRKFSALRMVEAIVLAAAMGVTLWVLFVAGQGIKTPNKGAIGLLLLWAGLRFEVCGATATYLIVSVTLGYLIERFHAGLSAADLASHNYILVYQLYIACGSVLLVPAIVLAEHRQSLDELRASEERFQMAVRGSTDGIWDWNLLTQEVFYSDRYRELLGYTHEEFPNLFASAEAVLHPDDVHRVLQAVDLHLKQRVPYDVEFRMRTKQGEYRWFRGRGQAIWNDAGKAVRMAGSITDITTAKMHGKLLRESEERFYKAFRSSPSGIAISEIDTGRFLDVNDSYCRIHQRTREELVGHTSVELGIFRDLSERENVIRVVRETGHIRDTLVKIPVAGGIQTLMFSAERVRLGGQDCMVSVVFDITRHLEIEENLARNGEQLRALTRRLEALREEERTHLAREIHDHLGQLLTALNLDLRLVEKRVANVAEPELRTALKEKVASARHLAAETITSVQKIASELRPAILDRVGLEAAIEAEAQAFEARTGVACQWSLPPEAISLAPEQATGLFRIFQELLTNVARHAQASHLSIRLLCEEQELTLEVEDDGIGMNPTVVTNPGSIGLLSMKERAALLGGEVAFYRGKNGGTAAIVRIPLNGSVPAAF